MLEQGPDIAEKQLAQHQYNHLLYTQHSTLQGPQTYHMPEKARYTALRGGTAIQLAIAAYTANCKGALAQ